MPASLFAIIIFYSLSDSAFCLGIQVWLLQGLDCQVTMRLQVAQEAPVQKNAHMALMAAILPLDSNLLTFLQ